MSFDAEFWVSVCTLVFLVLSFKYGKNLISSVLDARANKIRKELEEIDSIKKQANTTLEEYKNRQKIAEEEINNMLINAANELKHLQTNTENEINAYLNKRTNQTMSRIASFEREVLTQLKINAVKKSIYVINHIIKDFNNTNNKKIMLKDYFKDLGNIFNK